MSKIAEKEIAEVPIEDKDEALLVKKTYKTKKNTLAARLATHIKLEDLSKIQFTPKQAKILLGEDGPKKARQYTEEQKKAAVARLRVGLAKYHADMKLAKEEIAKENGEKPKLVLTVKRRAGAGEPIKLPKKVSIKPPSKAKGDVSDDEEPVSEEEKPSTDEDTDHIIHKVNKKVSKKRSKLAEINAKIEAQKPQPPVNPYAAQLKNLWG